MSDELLVKEISDKWWETLEDRHRMLLGACCDYAVGWEEAGLPGHNLMILVAELSLIIEALVLERRNRGGHRD